MNAPTGSGKPWYREPWPWALMLPPLLSVAGGVTMILLATHTPSALVVDDYARIEELTAERYARDGNAASLGLEAMLSVKSLQDANRGEHAGQNPDAARGLRADRGRLELSLIAPEGFAMPRALVLHLRHATNPEADRALRLVRFGDVYASEVEYAPGRYAIEVLPEDESWRLGSPVARLQGEIRLRAQAKARAQLPVQMGSQAQSQSQTQASGN